MSEPTFEIVFRGKLLRDFDRATVVNNLMALFRIDAARVEAMLAQQKLVLKRGLSKEAAARYQDTLRQAGVMVAAISEAPVQAAEPASAAPARDVVAAAAATVSAPSAATPPAPTPARATAASGGALTLAEVGTPVLEAQSRPATRNYDLSAFTLDAPGAVLVHKAAPPVRNFDTSLLELAPQPEAVPEAPPSDLTRKLFE